MELGDDYPTTARERLVMARNAVLVAKRLADEIESGPGKTLADDWLAEAVTRWLELKAEVAREQPGGSPGPGTPQQ